MGFGDFLFIVAVAMGGSFFIGWILGHEEGWQQAQNIYEKIYRKQP